MRSKIDGRKTMPQRLSLAALLVLACGPAAAQGWFTDRTNNAIVNADQIGARFREQISAELERVNRRAAQPPRPSNSEIQAMRTADRWWLRQPPRGTGEGGTPIRLSLAYLYDSALLNSAQIRVFGDLPAIRENVEREVAGRYTPRAYAEGRYEELNDPTRNRANTRGGERLLQREQGVEFGVRQRIVTGGEITIGQRFFNISTNSTDYAPNNQSRARTFVTIVQPVLRDSGVAYTRSLHEVARLDARVAQAEFRRQTESHLLDIARAYWGLQLARAAHAQRQRAAANIGALVGQIEGRSELDADPLLLSRARTALSLRQADLLRSLAAMRNAEARIRGLVNDPRFEAAGAGELLPTDATLAIYEPIALQAVLERAVALRPEVQQLFLSHRAAVLREGQAQIEALPRFDIVLEGNYGGRGLDTWQWGEAWRDTGRNTNRLGGVIGMRIEVPLGGDDLRARLDRRRLETRQIESQGRATLATIIAEAEVTLNEYNVAYREMAARAGAMRSAARDLAIETERWEQGLAGGRGEGAANALERRLAAQERLTDAEERLATAEVTFTLAFLALQRVQGTFTSLQSLEMARVDDAARGPSYVFRRDPTGPTARQPSPPQPAGQRR
jgi:outer membrane protein TolC